MGQGTPADADFRFTVSSLAGNAVPLLTHAGVVTAIDASFVVEINELWNVPPVILPGAQEPGIASCRWVNVDSDAYLMHAFIYLFDIRVRELTPMGPLLWARGST